MKKIFFLLGMVFSIMVSQAQFASYAPPLNSTACSFSVNALVKGQDGNYWPVFLDITVDIANHPGSVTVNNAPAIFQGTEPDPSSVSIYHDFYKGSYFHLGDILIEVTRNINRSTIYYVNLYS